MKATLIITGDDMQVNLDADTDTERRILSALKEGVKFTVMSGSNIALARGGSLRSFGYSPIHSDRRAPEAIALVLDREDKAE